MSRVFAATGGRDKQPAPFTTNELALPETYTPGEIYTTDVTGELDIVLTDFDVEPPSIGGFVVVEDEARLEVLFSATG